MKHVLKESLVQSYAIEPFFTGLRVEVDSKSEYLFTCCRRTQISVTLIESGKVLKSIPPNVLPEEAGVGNEGDDIVNFTVSQTGDSEHLVIAYGSGLLKQWSWRENPPQISRVWKSFHVGPIARLLFDPTASTLLASGGCDSTVKVWDIVRQYCTHHLKGAAGVISAMAYQPTPGETYYLLGSGDHENKIAVWDLISSKLVAKMEGHSGSVTSIVFYEDDHKKVISSSRDKILIIWCLQSFSALRKFPVFEPIESLCFLPKMQKFSWMGSKKIKGRLVIVGGHKGLLKVIDPENGSLAYCQQNSLLAKERKHGAEEAEGEDVPLITQTVHCKAINEIAVVSHEHNIIFHSLDDFKLTKQLIGHNDEVLAAKLLGPDESHLVVATNSPIIKVFSLKTSSCTTLTGHLDIVLSLEVFPNDPYLLASSSKDNCIRIWKFEPLTMEATCYFRGSGHSRSVTSLAVPFKSSNWIVTGSEDTTLKIWKIPDTEKVPLVSLDPVAGISLNTTDAVKAHDKDINSLAISPNDKLICSGSQDKTAKIWSLSDTLKLEQLGTLRGHRRGIWCVIFSPVDQVIATSSADTTIKLWSLSDYSCLKTFQGHDCSVLSVLFMSRGMQLISTSSDGNLKMWSIKQNECIKTIDAHEDKTWALTMPRDESLVITGAADSRLVVWRDVTVEEQEEEAQKRDNWVANEQTLMNLIQRKKWTKALKMAIRLDQPFRALNIIKEILLEDHQHFEEALNGLREDQMVSLLRFSLQWNTNSKHCLAAQAVLKSVFLKLGPDAILNAPDGKQLVEGLLPYTERHFQRFNRLLQQVTFIDFLWSNMKLTEDGPHSRAEEEEEEVAQDWDGLKDKGRVEDLAGSGYIEEEVEDEEEGEERGDDVADEANISKVDDSDSGLSSGAEKLESGDESRSKSKKSLRIAGRKVLTKRGKRN